MTDGTDTQEIAVEDTLSDIRCTFLVLRGRLSTHWPCGKEIATESVPTGSIASALSVQETILS